MCCFRKTTAAFPTTWGEVPQLIAFGLIQETDQHYLHADATDPLVTITNKNSPNFLDWYTSGKASDKNRITADRSLQQSHVIIKFCIKKPFLAILTEVLDVHTSTRQYISVSKQHCGVYAKAVMERKWHDYYSSLLFVDCCRRL